MHIAAQDCADISKITYCVTGSKFIREIGAKRLQRAPNFSFSDQLFLFLIIKITFFPPPWLIIKNHTHYSRLTRTQLWIKLRPE